MCLFDQNSSDLDDCGHIQCALIFTIQKQNPKIFPQMETYNNHSKKYIYGVSQIIKTTEFVPAQNKIIQEQKESLVKSQPIENFPQNEHIQVFKQTSNNYDENQNKEHFYQHNPEINNHLKINNANANSPQESEDKKRIKELQFQVAYLKQCMKKLVEQLKYKGSINRSFQF